MCEECLNHALATIYGEEKSRWYFSPHAYDHESYVASLDKSAEYGNQYEIINAIRACPINRKRYFTLPPR